MEIVEKTHKALIFLGFFENFACEFPVVNQRINCGQVVTKLRPGTKNCRQRQKNRKTSKIEKI